MRNDNPAAGLTSSIEPEAHDNTRRVDVVPPKKLKTELDLREICMRVRMWADCLYGAVPDTICFDTLLILFSPCMRTDHLTDVISHGVEPVHPRLQVDNIESLHVP